MLLLDGVVQLMFIAYRSMKSSLVLALVPACTSSSLWRARITGALAGGAVLPMKVTGVKVWKP